MMHVNKVLRWSLPAAMLLGMAGCGVYPVVDAGLDQVVAENQPVQLTATNRSAATISAYIWEQIDGPAVSLSNADSKSAGFTAPFIDEQTTLSFRVTGYSPLLSLDLPVLDSTIPLDVPNSDIVDVTVMPNPAPEVDAGPDQTVAPGSSVTLIGEAFIDAENLPLRYQWTQRAGSTVRLTGSRTLTASFDTPLLPDNTVLVLEFELTAEAEPGNIAGDTVTVVVSTSETATDDSDTTE